MKRTLLDSNTIIYIFQNALAYPIRQLVKWRRGPLTFPNDPKDDLFEHLAEEEQSQAYNIEKRFKKKYGLKHLWNNSTRDNYRLNLFYIEMLERAFSEARPVLSCTIKAADIGASDWFYVQGLFAFLQRWNTSEPRDVCLTGYEADAFRVYSDYFSRFDYAHGYMKNLTGANYEAKTFEASPDRFDIITLFFPFVFLKEHLAWGLPYKIHRPQRLLDQTLYSLKRGGVLLIVNQGNEEHEKQIDLLNQRGIQPLISFQHRSPLYHYDIPRYVILSVIY